VEAAELDPKPDPAQKDRRVFTYQLRPSSVDVKLIPEVRFLYFDPRRRVPEDRPLDRFPTVFSNAIAIQVRAPAQPPAESTIPLEVPSYLAEFSTGDRVFSAPKPCCPPWVWLLALVMPPLLAIAWVLVWLQLYPDAARLVQLRRHRAVRHALATLAAVRRRPGDDPAGKIADALIGYLHQRFDLPLFARTPREVAEHLRTQQMPPEHIDVAAAFLRAGDAARFSPAHSSAAELAEETARLIVRLEERA
jgi:hypothetical protein